MQLLSNTSSIRALQTHANGFGFAETTDEQPRRKTLTAPPGDGSFVKPVKQSFVKNARLMPGTRIMLAVLAGWAGRGGPIETTLGIIARHVARSPRQVQRYIKDAIEEGYLRTSYVKDRIGRITGLRVHLTRFAIFRDPAVRSGDAESLATTSSSPNKGNKSITNCWEGWLTRQAASRGSRSVGANTPSDSLASKGRLLLAAACRADAGREQRKL